MRRPRRLYKTLSTIVIIILLPFALILYLFPTSLRNGTALNSQSPANDYEQIRARLGDIKLINYYPTNNPQVKMWSNWDAVVIDKDFARIADLHANTVRIAIFTETFEYPLPSDEMQRRLEQLISLADKHGLRVQLALFGFFSKYNDLEGSEKWVSALLSRHQNDSRIAFIDLFNEMNTSDPQAVAWAKHMVPYLRKLLVSIPVTVSVSSGSGINGLHQLKNSGVPIDFYSLHYYGKPELAHQTFVQALQMVSPTPLFIGETGRTTLPPTTGVDNNYNQTWWEAYQDQYYRTVNYAARSLDLPPTAPWVFSDFAEGAYLQKVDAAEYHFGLFRIDGSEKPAALSISKIFGGDKVDTAFNNGFEIGDGSSLPVYWKLWHPSNANFVRDTNNHHSGTASAKISNSLYAGPDSPGFYLAPIKFIMPDQTYMATVWAKGANATGVTRIVLAWFDANSKYISTSTSQNFQNGNTDWQQISVKAKAPTNARWVEIHLESKNNRGTVWFDDVTFE